MRFPCCHWRQYTCTRSPLSGGGLDMFCFHVKWCVKCMSWKETSLTLSHVDIFVKTNGRYPCKCNLHLSVTTTRWSFLFSSVIPFAYTSHLPEYFIPPVWSLPPHSSGLVHINLVPNFSALDQILHPNLFPFAHSHGDCVLAYSSDSMCHQILRGSYETMLQDTKKKRWINATVDTRELSMLCWTTRMETWASRCRLCKRWAAANPGGKPFWSS